MTDIPSFIGLSPEDAEALAAAHGLTLAWDYAPKMNLLPPAHEPRVGRQRRREDGTVELLVVYAPTVVIPEAMP